MADGSRRSLEDASTDRFRMLELPSDRELLERLQAEQQAKEAGAQLFAEHFRKVDKPEAITTTTAAKINKLKPLALQEEIDALEERARELAEKISKLEKICATFQAALKSRYASDHLITPHLLAQEKWMDTVEESNDPFFIEIDRLQDEATAIADTLEEELAMAFYDNGWLQKDNGDGFKTALGILKIELERTYRKLDTLKISKPAPAIELE